MWTKIYARGSRSCWKEFKHTFHPCDLLAGPLENIPGKEQALKESICTTQPKNLCEGCSLDTELMCRYDARDTLHFFMLVLPFFVTAIGGVIASGYGWWLLGWLAYMLLFFFIWEGRVLCSHCPYWSDKSRLLRCHANYGVLKLWRYRPGPMSVWEQAQFLIGALLFILYPMLFLFIGHAYLLAGIGLASAASFGYLLHRNVCVRCVNFSCPLNHVAKQVVEAYLAKNPLMRHAWEGRLSGRD
jgi:hypothetical protein